MGATTRREAPPSFVSAVQGRESSRARISITRGEQKPPWQRPMPARVRRFTASSVVAPRRMASTISASVTVSHRQTMRPWSGLAAMAAARCASSILRKGAGRSRRGFRSARSRSASPASARRPSTVSAIAGALVKPGEQMPAARTSRGHATLRRMTKSPSLGCARSPAKSVIALRKSRSGTLRSPTFLSVAMPSAVTDVSVLLSWSTAVGPANVLPSTVGETRMPLPSFVGHGNSTRASGAAARSSRRYSPLRARIENESSPSRRATSSAKTPAASTTNRARKVSAPAATSTASPRSRRAVTGAPSFQTAPFARAFSAQAMQNS